MHIIGHLDMDAFFAAVEERDHPEWHEKNRMCRKCIEYYRRLVKENEI